jgi:NitT/TauT family transport system permease protein
MTPRVEERKQSHQLGQLVGTVVMLLIVWEVVVRVGDIWPYILPAPSAVARAALLHGPLLLSAARVTFVEMVVGLSVGTLVGITLAVIFTQSRTVRDVGFPLLIAFDGTPKVALAPILIVWTGLGLTPKIVLAAALAFYPVTVHLTRAMSSVDEEVILFVRALQPQTWRLYQKVFFPAAVPALFDALRQAIPLAMVGAVIGEFIASEEGLGHALLTAVNTLNMALGFAAFLLMSMISAGCYLMLRPFERRFLRWLPSTGA